MYVHEFLRKSVFVKYKKQKYESEIRIQSVKRYECCINFKLVDFLWIIRATTNLTSGVAVLVFVASNFLRGIVDRPVFSRLWFHICLSQWLVANQTLSALLFNTNNNNIPRALVRKWMQRHLLDFELDTTIPNSASITTTLRPCASSLEVCLCVFVGDPTVRLGQIVLVI